MPWRLVVFIVLFVIFFLFIVLNLENKSDISFGFTVIRDIPVFVTAFSAFIVGMFCTLPFIFSFKSKKKAGDVQGKGLLAKITGKPVKNPGEKAGDSGLADKSHYGID
jgi:uncharacterized integral membrane protein